MAGEAAPALYADGPTVELEVLAPSAPWAVVAATGAEAAALASDVPDAAPAVVGLDEPGWRARLALLPPATAVVVAAGEPSATLPALRALEPHPGVVVLRGERGGAGDGLGGPDRASVLAQRAGGALLVLDGPTRALVRRRRSALRSAGAGRAHGRLARLAEAGARLAAVGGAAHRALGGSTWPALDDVDAAADWTPAWEQRGAPRPEVLLLDASAPAAGAARERATDLGIVVVDAADRTVPVIEPTVDNPIGWRREPTAGTLALAADAALPADLADHRDVVVAAGATSRAADLALLLVRLAARGLPARLEGPRSDVDALLGAGLREALADAARADLDDLAARERASVALRRAALAEHGADAAARDVAAAAGLTARPAPPVSVLLATRRPEALPAAVARIAAQTHRPLEAVVIAHGPGVAEAAHAALATVDLPAVVVDADPALPLGAALDEGVAAAGGQVLAKMDDDDWYGPHHVADCVGALRYSGAPLVGKGAEFIWLGAVGRTVRRSSRYAERFHTGVSGASLVIAADDLAALGGWAHQRRAVDRRLIDAVERAGERPYRLHGLEFCVNRHDVDSTWTVDAAYFLRRAEAQWPRLALDEAGLDG